MLFWVVQIFWFKNGNAEYLKLDNLRSLAIFLSIFREYEIPPPIYTFENEAHGQVYLAIIRTPLYHKKVMGAFCFSEEIPRNYIRLDFDSGEIELRNDTKEPSGIYLPIVKLVRKKNEPLAIEPSNSVLQSILHREVFEVSSLKDLLRISLNRRFYRVIFIANERNFFTIGKPKKREKKLICIFLYREARRNINGKSNLCEHDNDVVLWDTNRGNSTGKCVPVIAIQGTYNITLNH